MRIQRLALALLLVIALQSSCRNLDDGPTNVRGGAGGSAGDAARAGAEMGNRGNAGEAGQSETSGAAGEAETTPMGNGGAAGSDGRIGASSGTAGRLSGDLSESAAGTVQDILDPNPEQVAKPGCVSWEKKEIGNLIAPHALAANVIPNGVPYVLYLADPQLNTTLIRWLDLDSSSWTAWGCFDSVVYPEQLSAINVADQNPPYSTPEVYATNAAGRLFVRRFYDAGWGYWDVIGLPRAKSHLTDVGACSTPSTLPTVFVLDDGRIFGRHHVSADAYSDYSPWREISGVPGGAVHLCAGVRPDLHQQLFVSTAEGKVYSAVRTTADADGEFGAFQEATQTPAPTMTDIDCGTLADDTLAVLGLSSGSVWTLPSNLGGSTGWRAEPMRLGLTLSVFTVGSFPESAPTVFGVDPTNKTWSHVLGSDGWAPIP